MRLEHHPPLRLRQSGFSLLEMTIVLAVLAVVLAGALPFLTETTKSKDADETLTRITAIEEALLAYYVAGTTPHTLPCPALPTLDADDDDFGKSVTDVDCATAGIIGSGGNVVGGTVPVRDLSLPDEYAFDGWGRRFTYYIHIDANVDTSFDSGVLTVKEKFDSAEDLTVTASYVVISHGPNGLCSYLRSGQPMSDSANDDELANCPITIDNLFVKRSAGYGTPAAPTDDDFYDDVVRFRPRVLVEYSFGGTAILPLDCPIDKDPVVWSTTTNRFMCESLAP